MLVILNSCGDVRVSSCKRRQASPCSAGACVPDHGDDEDGDCAGEAVVDAEDDRPATTSRAARQNSSQICLAQFSLRTACRKGLGDSFRVTNLAAGMPALCTHCTFLGTTSSFPSLLPDCPLACGVGEGMLAE
eukprot:3034532-Pleurochrysis_carterae.AAC.2